MQDIMRRLRHHDLAEGIAEQDNSPADEGDYPNETEFSEGLKEIVVCP